MVQRVRRRFAARNDAGISLVELVIAVVIIIIVLLSGTVAIDFALSASNTQRLKIEATNLAVSIMEQDQQIAASLGIGQTTTTETINTTTFTIVTNVTDFAQNGSQLTTVCTSSSAAVSQQIWQVTVTVTWPQMNGAPPISQTTEVAPGKANAFDLTNGEIGVAVNEPALPPHMTALNFTVTPKYIGSASPSPPYPTPSGQSDPSGTVFNTGDSGCGVVSGLAPDASWDYVVTLENNPGWVSSNELSDANVIGAIAQDPTETLTALAGQVSHTVPPFQMAPGVTTTITLQPVSYLCTGGSPAASCDLHPGDPGYAAPVTTLPISFGNPSLSGNQYTFGNGTTAVTSELLYPYSSYAVWTGDMALSSPGATVTGTSNYVYAGSHGTDTPAPVNLSFPGGTTAAVSVPTYDLSLSISSPCTGDVLSAQEQGASTSYALNTTSATTSVSGMPLGQYLLSLSATGPSCPALAASPPSAGLYVWITPTGVYQSGSPTSNPYTGTQVSGSLKVTE
ncbi:MAG: hypothetical protein ACYCST_11930 [Acidimicrobiales bacterium]